MGRYQPPERRQVVNRVTLATLLDHSVLKPETTDKDIAAGAEVVRRWGIRYYCVPPAWVSQASEALLRVARVVSVIGFPLGYDRPAVKALAAELSVRDGAAEVDMVMNVGLLKAGRRQAVADDVGAVVAAVPGAPVKVILETALLSREEKVLACRIVQDAGAAFVKTSTGFNPAGGATLEDVRLLRSCVGPAFGVKAAGGIRTLADARALVEAGASRLGTSSSAQILAELPPV
jgi:deoxyribose-phosphate aldolase